MGGDLGERDGERAGVDGEEDVGDDEEEEDDVGLVARWYGKVGGAGEGVLRVCVLVGRGRLGRGGVVGHRGRGLSPG